MEAKKPYTAPRLVEHGRVEDITRGLWGGYTDWFTGRNDDFPIGTGDPNTGGHTSN